MSSRPQQAPRPHVTGKQLPPSIAAATATATASFSTNERTMEDDDDNIESSSALSEWKLCDASVELRRDRLELMRRNKEKVDISAEDDDDDDSDGEHPSSNKSMKLSTRFDDIDDNDAMASRLQHKEEIIRLAFQEAASTVLRAIQTKVTTASAVAVDGSSSGTSHATWRADLPLVLRNALEHQRLSGASTDIADTPPENRTFDEVRSYCLERSFENKEYTKRKGGKTESNTFVARPKKVGGPKASPKPQPPPTPKTTTPSKVTSLLTSTSIAPPITSSDADAAAVANAATASGSVATTTAAAALPKFTRNTPASSAAALDHRINTSRAILCVTGNIVFDALTPSPALNINATGGATTATPPLDVLDVPQNIKTNTESKLAVATVTTETNVNMGAALIEAQTLGQRTISIVENAMKRARLRYQYRKDNVRYDAKQTNYDNRNFLRLENPWSFHQRFPPIDSEDGDDESDDSHEQQLAHTDAAIPHQPNPESVTFHWQNMCLPRFLAILEMGAGHAIYHDCDWPSRHGRVADLLRSLAAAAPTKNGNKDETTVRDKTIHRREAGDNENFGPHLIVTTEPEVARFAQEFVDVRHSLRRLVLRPSDHSSLRALAYRGNKRQRRDLRKYFSQASGLAEAPFHVLITSYKSFLKDYLHFCQVPFETVVLDDGASWMATKDQSSLGLMWDSAIFSSNDHNVGLAGTSFKEWDFSQDKIPDRVIKEACIGLTARHRIATASTMAMKQRATQELLPVSGMLDFVAPQFAAVVKEEWDRSKINASGASMTHFRKLVARSVIVHCPECPAQEMTALALQALNGELVQQQPDRSSEPVVPSFISDDEFVAAGKIASSRRATLQWLGLSNRSWLRYELGSSTFQPILDAAKQSVNHGHFCEEVTTASSVTASGATGQVTGTMAYRFAIRCGRHFGSEPGLRQHISAQHAPPATWLCRTCFSDCITSQARTHHERTCGQPINGTEIEDVKDAPVAKKSGVGKKKTTRPVQPGTTSAHDKDPDGSFRVPGYRGVWVNKAGKHFIMIDGQQYKDKSVVTLFDSTDDAAKKHDEIVQTKQSNAAALELNFKPDGTRIVYEDPSNTTSGLGGSAASVVPALSVINIKDLPPDVKPLLRDPRQTSRTGGNSKRHIYAYRGVCRQARKGHDRWQAQISFMGVNHYLGTFDSEWDAAAIYAWAHLILYGEEATRLAQKEGEEAAAAYEQEKKDIADGKIPEPVQKLEKKKKAPVRKPKGKNDEVEGDADGEPNSKKRTASPREGVAKKPRTSSKDPKSEKEMLASILAKGVAKAPMLAPRAEFNSTSDADLLVVASRKLKLSRTSAPFSVRAADGFMRPCFVGFATPKLGGAMLVGLAPSSFGWDLQRFVESSQLGSEQDAMAALQLLAVEYDDDGANERFRSIMQGTFCLIGAAGKETQHAYNYLGLGSVPVGGSIGKLDCHIGGVPGSCSERAACIQYLPSGSSMFQFSCLSNEDVVTLNGRRIDIDAGPLPLFDDDICSVGARVFVFVTPKDD